MLLENKVAIVTGGTRGIGLAIVRQYLRNGAKVALCGSTEKTANAALDKIKTEYPGADIMAIHPVLTDPQSVADAFASVVGHFGRIDILANNAGISQSTPLDQYTEKEIDDILNLNIKALIVCSQAVARIMRTGGGGVIINTSSVVSLYGQSTGCGYPASKFAVNGITRSLARELAKDRIRVCAVAPGIIHTDMVDRLPENMIKPLIDRIPLGRMGTPDDIADAFVFLACDHASYITGTILSVDGGVII